jgi:hypothetical protein
MREPEGDSSLLPASSFERPRSECRDPYFRDIEVAGRAACPRRLRQLLQPTVYGVCDNTNRRLNLVHDQVDWVATHRSGLESPLRHDQTPTAGDQPPGSRRGSAALWGYCAGLDRPCISSPG